MDLEAAFHCPRLDASATGTITMDARLGPEVAAALATVGPAVSAAPEPYPLHWACPSAVMRNANGVNHGMNEPFQPCADAVAEAPGSGEPP